MSPAPADILLRNGLVFDGGGDAPFRADIAIRDGLIIAVGDLADLPAGKSFDLGGRAVAPGFIDVHSHDDYACIRQPEMTAKISQGVTTVVVGNCGLSIAPLRFPNEPEEPFNLLGDARALPTMPLPSTRLGRRSMWRLWSATPPCAASVYRTSKRPPARQNANRCRPCWPRRWKPARPV